MAELLTREAALAKAENPRRYTIVGVPSGGAMRIRSLRAGEKNDWEASLLSKSGQGANRNKLRTAQQSMVMLCVVDANGDLLFNANDIEALSRWDSADLDHVSKECRKHCGFDDEDFEALVKNSGAVHVED